MEIEGHPTLDLVTELEQRGALRVRGTDAGPNPDAPEAAGLWLFLPPETFLTGLDDPPGQTPPDTQD